MVANASRRPGIAAEFAAIARFVGYRDVIATDALDVTRATKVLYAPGLAREAERLAEDLGLVEVTVAPVSSSPVVAPEITGDVYVLIGTDQID